MSLSLSRLSRLRRGLITVSSRTQGREDHQQDREGDGGRRHYSVVTGALLGASLAFNLLADQDRRRSQQSLLSRLSSITPVVNAAEPTDNPKDPPKSRRKEFNFIADLVEETGKGRALTEQ